jgi:hypothetical protein
LGQLVLEFPNLKQEIYVKTAKKKSKEIGAAEPQAGPVREVVTRSGQWKKGIVNCPTLPAPVQHESALEKSFIQRASLCLPVKYIRHQPYRVGRHTLDFEVGMHTARIAVEVKIAKKVPDYIEAFNNTAARLAEKGIRFYVLTEQEIRAEHRDEHAAEVLRYAKAQVTFEEHARVTETLTANGAMSAPRLQEAARVDAQTLQHLVARRFLTCEPTLVVEEHCTLYIARQPDNPVTYFESYFGVRPWSAQKVVLVPARAKRGELKRRPKRIGPVLRPEHSQDHRDGMTNIAGGTQVR